MCTAIAWQKDVFLFGRNLDLEYRYQEDVTITPRKYPFPFRNGRISEKHPAIIGTAYVRTDYPLYYDGFNEYGLCAAGLSFPDYAYYVPETAQTEGISPFELIPYILCHCKTCEEAVELLKQTIIADIPFSPELPNTPLHWMIADKKDAYVIEPTNDGIMFYENTLGILTNSPPFPFHLNNASQYWHLSANQPPCKYPKPLFPFSNGLGGIGLPGDLSSPSRFIRAVFTKENSAGNANGTNMISQFFHILGSVGQQEGSVIVNNKYEKTVYSNCFSVTDGIYYYTTYHNRQITGVDLFAEDLNGNTLIRYPMDEKESILWKNKKPDHS